jgi:hypothetical protein
MKTLSNSTDCSANRTRMSITALLLCHWSFFQCPSNCPALIECRKNPPKRTVHIMGSFKTIFRVAGGLRNNYKSHWRLTESQNNLPEAGSVRIPELINVFIEAWKTFQFNFLRNKGFTKMFKPSPSYQKALI